MPVLVVILVRSFFGEFFRFLGVCVTNLLFLNHGLSKRTAEAIKVNGRH